MPISRSKVDVCTSWGKVSAGWYIFFRFCWFGVFIEIYWTNSTIWGTMLAFISMSFPYWVLNFSLTSDVIIFFGFLSPNLQSEYSCVSWDLNCILTVRSLLIYVHLLPSIHEYSCFFTVQYFRVFNICKCSFLNYFLSNCNKIVFLWSEFSSVPFLSIPGFFVIPNFIGHRFWWCLFFSWQWTHTWLWSLHSFAKWTSFKHMKHHSFKVD